MSDAETGIPDDSVEAAFHRATPILRADATDDDLQHEPEEAAPVRMVPVVIDGVMHGMRPAQEGEL